MRILLVCAAGMSTSLLVNNMNKFANEDDFIEARSVGNLEEIVDNFDVILVGPQIRYKFNQIEKICKAHGKEVALMDMQAYGQMDGKIAIDQAKTFSKK